MNSFPTISNNQLTDCFQRLVTLFENDKRKILEATERATGGQITPYTITAAPVDDQITVIKRRIMRTADKDGQHLLIRIVEELFDSLGVDGAVGVTGETFLNAIYFDFDDRSMIKYLRSNDWIWQWNLSVDVNELEINIGIRNKDFAPPEIVPDYVLQYIQQAIIAFNNSRNAAALALMSIALEGTLRDALADRGYTYTYGAPTQDVYELVNMQVFPDPHGFKVQFPTPMPITHTLFLSNAGDPPHNTCRIKRINRNGTTFLEIRDAANLLDYWSSSTVVTPGTMNISGLGAAINIARNSATFLSDIDLPNDLDDVIQNVRNNLIHLSNSALLELVDTSSGRIPLGDFIKDKNKVSDTVLSIAEAINSIYGRLTRGTL